jgi:predicted nucleic acid-binding protein
MRIALDTNILAYAEGINDAARRDAVIEVLERLPQGAVVVPAQVLGELFNVLVRKAGRAPALVRDAILAWSDIYAVAATTQEAMVAAVDLAADHRLSIWDATILAVASQTGCRFLLSEDLQDGFTWGGVTVANPFAEARHATLAALIDGSSN